MVELGVLHLVRAQCTNSSLVTIVKVVERCFSDGFTVRFEMYDAAPASPPAPLPYFNKPDGTLITDEIELGKYLAGEGCASLLDGDAAAMASLFAESNALAKPVKIATKSKTAEAMEMNQAILIEALESLEVKLAASEFLASPAFSLADIVCIATLKPAFEKVLDPPTREKIPSVTAWYQKCHITSEAVRKVLGPEPLCDAVKLEVKASKETKEEKKAREKARKKEKDAAKKQEAAAAGGKGGGAGEKKVHELAVTPRSVDFAQWYADVIIKGELLSRYNIPGLFVLRPAAFAMWEAIQAWFDAKIKTVGVENCMFPLFIREDVLSKEEQHLEGFSAEVAWVTASGDRQLDERLAIRPTSETAMYPYYAEWIRSHRDLPLLLNQWTSVVRMETTQTTPFVRTKEFLWQEGHTAHATEEEARELVLKILGWYRCIYEDLMAVPVIPGWKSEKEKFDGADATSTVEAFIPHSGKGIQGATSHCLGQNFAKMFDVKFSDADAQERYVWQTSWGCTTRTLGVMIMTHGDDKGLVLPPRIAPKHAVIVPITMASHSEEQVAVVHGKAEELVTILKDAGVKASADLRENYTPGHKYSHWELKGVCVRLELGPMDMEKKSVMTVRRDTGQKEAVAWADLAKRVPEVLLEMQKAMFDKAKEAVDAALETVYNFEDFKKALAEKKRILAPWVPDNSVEEGVKKMTRVDGDAETGEGMMAGAKTLCIPFEQPDMPKGQKCIFAEALNNKSLDATCFALWGRSY